MRHRLLSAINRERDQAYSIVWFRTRTKSLQDS